jgi:hypothetical protein
MVRLFYIVIFTLFFCSCAVRRGAVSGGVSACILEEIKQIDKDPYRVDFEYTPAVDKLIGFGRRSLRPELIELLAHENFLTRVHAWRVVEGVTMVEMGFNPGHGWSSADAEKRWVKLWRENGSYNPEMAADARHLAAQKWQDWVRTKNNKSQNFTRSVVATSLPTKYALAQTCLK